MLHHPIFLKENPCCTWITRFPLVQATTVKRLKKCVKLPQNTSKEAEINRNCINFDTKIDWFQLFGWKFSCLLKYIKSHWLNQIPLTWRTHQSHFVLPSTNCHKTKYFNYLQLTGKARDQQADDIFYFTDQLIRFTCCSVFQLKILEGKKL